MPRLVLDTNILIDDFRGLRPYSSKRPTDAEARARELIDNRATDAIVSPVEIEFLCGIVDRHEMELAEAYLRRFRVIDRHETLPQDWAETRNVARHVVAHERPGDFGDCLIIAICRRLKFDLISSDKGLHQQRGRTRQRRP